MGQVESRRSGSDDIVIAVRGRDGRESDRLSFDLARDLSREVANLEVQRRRTDPDAQDLGPVLIVIAQSGALLALCTSIGTWIARHREVGLHLTKTNADGSQTTVDISNADTATAAGLARAFLGVSDDT